MVCFNRRAFGISLVLFTILVFIALYVRDSFIRPFVGDVLAVIWVYYGLLSFFKLPKLWLSVGALTFAYCIEIAQYLNLIKILGMSDVKVARIVLGSTFDWYDLLAYTLGWFLIWVTIKTSRDETKKIG